MSRYHAELNEDTDKDGLRIKCFSSNGLLINQTVYLEKDKSYILGNSDTFSIGDASEDYKDPIQVIMFAVRSEIVDTEAPKGAKSKEQQQAAVSTNGSHDQVDRKTVIGSSNACPILILDDDEDDDYPLDDDGYASARVENNEGLSAMLMKFKDEPVDEDEGNSTSSPTTSSPATSSPVILPSETVVSPRTSVEKPLEYPPKNKNLQASVVSPRPSVDSTTESQANTFNSPPRYSPPPPRLREAPNAAEAHAKSFSSPPAGSPPPPRLRECPNFTPTFRAYRQCILKLDVSKPDGDPNQGSEKMFIDFVQEHGKSAALGDVTRVLFSFFCVGAASRVKLAWWKALEENSRKARKAAILSQAGENEDIIRITVLVASEGRGYFSDCTAVKLSANFVRLGGQGTKKRTLLGMVHKYEFIDRRRRGGSIQVPQLLFDDGRAPDIVDRLEIDLDKSTFSGSVSSIPLLEIEQQFLWLAPSLSSDS